MSVIPPWVSEAMVDAKRGTLFRRDPNASELGGAKGVLSGSPAPGLSPPVTPKTGVAESKTADAPHNWA